MNKCQRIQLERIKLGSFNDFDGELVAKDLQQHEALWKAFVWGRFKYNQLIELRDLADDCINADTLYILCKEENVAFFESLAEDKWKANEIGHYYIKNNEVATEGTIDFRRNELFSALGGGLDDGYALIRLWWD